MLYKNANIYAGQGFFQGDLRVKEDTITETGQDLKPQTGEEEQNLEGMYVVPGFWDIHTHGAVGVDINHAGAEDLERMCVFFAAQGTTSWLCSVLTDTEEATNRAIDAYMEWKELPHHGATLQGIHLEGPFLAPQYKGAMPEHLLQQPSAALIRRYQERAQGAIRYITIAPEMPGALELIPELTAMGIRVALGHSAADYATTVQAIRNGATAATHTGNAMRLWHQHEPAIFGAVLEHREVYCEVICDGLHLHPATVRLILQHKGNERVVAITDSIMAAGLADGEYMLGVNEIVVKDGDAKLKTDGTRAGSTLTMGRALQNLRAFTQMPLHQLVPLFTENPVRLLGEDASYGTIQPGKTADFVVLDADLQVRKTVVHGNLVYNSQK